MTPAPALPPAPPVAPALPRLPADLLREIAEAAGIATAHDPEDEQCPAARSA
jgi:hypothetical protein